MNLCDCSDTKFKGSTCSERYKQERIPGVDIIIRIASVVTIIMSLISVILLYYYKNEKIIKAGKF